ncbi:MAG: PspA-associated protein PspAA [Moorellaceae bacterium]
MIIRILTEGQYRVENEALSELDRLDDELLDAVAEGDAEEFHKRFQKVLALIRGRGTKVPDTELVESDLILPAPDTTLDEARELFDHYPRNLL